MKPSPNALPFIIAGLIAAAGAYWYFFMGSGNDAPLSPAIAENQAQTKFKVLVSELQPITFDTSIFSDPRFVGLMDLGTPVAPEASGRVDPFAPIPGVSGQ